MNDNNGDDFRGYLEPSHLPEPPTASTRELAYEPSTTNKKRGKK